MVNKSKQGDYKGKQKSSTNTSPELENIFTSKDSIKNIKENISKLNRDDKRELRAILNSSERTELKNKLSKKDIKTLLQLLDEIEEKVTLFKVDELRPVSWSKTVTLFDVYETDEENFVPYISPLATVGEVRSTGSGESADIGEAGTGIENPEEVPGVTQTGEQGEGNWWDSITNVITGGGQ